MASREGSHGLLNPLLTLLSLAGWWHRPRAYPNREQKHPVALPTTLLVVFCPGICPD